MWCKFLRQAWNKIHPPPTFSYLSKKRNCPPHILEGLRVRRPKQCWECLEARGMCTSAEVLGQRATMSHPQTNTNTNTSSGASSQNIGANTFSMLSFGLFWIGSAQISLNSSLLALEESSWPYFIRNCSFQLLDFAAQPFLIWVRLAILVQQLAHLSLSRSRFCLCRECGTLFAGREFLPENLWVKQGMGATAGEE